MNDITEDPTSINLRAWNVSEADEMTGANTACTRDKELGIHVWVGVLCRLAPISVSFRGFNSHFNGDRYSPFLGTYNHGRSLKSNDLYKNLTATWQQQQAMCASESQVLC